MRDHASSPLRCLLFRISRHGVATCVENNLGAALFRAAPLLLTSLTVEGGHAAAATAKVGVGGRLASLSELQQRVPAAVMQFAARAGVSTTPEEVNAALVFVVDPLADAVWVQQ